MKATQVTESQLKDERGGYWTIQSSKEDFVPGGAVSDGLAVRDGFEVDAGHVRPGDGRYGRYRHDSVSGEIVIIPEAD